MQSQAMQLLTSQTTDEWFTPAWITALAHAVMGGIDLDPASCAQANTTVQAKVFYATHGLEKPWFGRVYLNPPYSDTARWIAKATQELRTGHIEQAVLCVNSAPGYAWWETASRTYMTCMLRTRVAFVQPDGTIRGQNKKGTSLLYAGPYTARFMAYARPHGRILSTER